MSRDVIIVEALRLIDEEGLEAFSLRNLAKRLNVYPTAIYWYVPTRNQLLTEVATIALGNVPKEPYDGSWQDYLRSLFHAYREAFRAHPNLAPLVGSQLVTNASVDFAFLERLLEMLSKAGFKERALVGAYNSVIASLVGFAAQEFAPIPTENATLWREDLQARLSHIDAGVYPLLAENIELMANKAFILRWENGRTSPLDESFAVFVEAQIRGLEGLLR